MDNIELTSKGKEVNQNINYIAILCISLSIQAHAQEARSLFSAGHGVNIESKYESSPKNNTAKNAKNNTEIKEYSGLSYSFYQKMNDGNIKKISPQKKFTTGDQIKIILKVNQKGFLSILNIDPVGKLTVLAEKKATPNIDVTIPEKGFLKFSGDKGIEQLIFLLSSKPIKNNAETLGAGVSLEGVAAACESEQKNTRSLIVSDELGNQFNVVTPNGKCAVTENAASTRGLKVEVSEEIGYGVIPSDDLNTGQILSLKLKLQHE